MQHQLGGPAVEDAVEQLAALFVADGRIGQTCANSRVGVDDLPEVAQFLADRLGVVRFVGQLEQRLGVGDGQGRMVIVLVHDRISFVRRV